MPVQEQGGVTLSYVCPHCHHFSDCRHHLVGFEEARAKTIRCCAMDELRRFIKVDNHEAVRIGDLENNSMAIKVVGPMFD